MAKMKVGGGAGMPDGNQTKQREPPKEQRKVRLWMLNRDGVGSILENILRNILGHISIVWMLHTIRE